MQSEAEECCAYLKPPQSEIHYIIFVLHFGCSERFAYWPVLEASSNRLSEQPVVRCGHMTAVLLQRTCVSLQRCTWLIAPLAGTHTYTHTDCKNFLLSSAHLCPTSDFVFDRDQTWTWSNILYALTISWSSWSYLLKPVLWHAHTVIVAHCSHRCTQASLVGVFQVRFSQSKKRLWAWHVVSRPETEYTTSALL